MNKVLVRKLAIAFVLISSAGYSCSAEVSGSQTASNPIRSQILGTWRGNSECLVAKSPCHNEVNVYRFAEIPGKPGLVSVTASKVVEGKEVVMGTGEWNYDADKHLLSSDGSAGMFRFTVEGDKMEGTLTVKSGVVYRRIHLTRQK